MKEEWKVYIKGVLNRGNEVIKILEDLGAKNCVHYTGCNSHCLFYINHKGVVDWVPLDNETGQIIMDNYREIKLSERWKDGDLLIDINRTEYTIFKNYSFGNMFDSYIIVNKDNVKSFSNLLSCYAKFYRLASDEECKQFYELLHKHGKDWDAEKKHLVDWRWKPKEKEVYWYVDIEGHLANVTSYNDTFDNSMYDFGNCFRTKEEAEKMAEKIKKLFKGE